MTRKNPNHIAAQWELFLTACNIPGAPPSQLVDMRRSFFAGATAFFAIATLGVGASPDVEADEIQLMEDLDAELRAFADRVQTRSDSEDFGN